MKRKATLALLLAASALLIYQIGLLLSVIWYGAYNPADTAFMRATLAQLRGRQPDAQLKHDWVDYANISNHLKRAVIAAEDANFTSHGGVEWSAIRQAWDYNRQQTQGNGSGSRMRGGSTITQQLAKNLYLSGDRSYLRKAQELVLSYMLELTMSKQRILELYLNTAQWGTNIFGAEAAARHYFNRSAKTLTPTQAAQLAAMLPSPAYYHRHGNTSYLRSRTNTIAQRMQLVQAP